MVLQSKSQNAEKCSDSAGSYKDLVLASEYDNVSDILSDYEVFIRNIYSRLSSVILIKIQKRGVCINHNTYTGYDSEFYLKDECKNLNELLSIQLAVNTRFVINIPKQNHFKVRENINALTGQLYKAKYPLVCKLSGAFENCIQANIDRIRDLLYPGYDGIMLNFTNKLKLSGYKQVIVEDRSISQFVTDFTPVKTFFK